MNAVTRSDTPAETRTGQAGSDPAPALRPPVDVVEDSSGITLFADLPGVPKDRLDLRVEGEQLSIEAEVAVPAPDGMESVHGEVTVPRYRRVFTLSKELDTEHIGAEFEHGVLKIRIPKAQHAQPRRIEVKPG